MWPSGTSASVTIAGPLPLLLDELLAGFMVGLVCLTHDFSGMILLKGLDWRKTGFISSYFWMSLFYYLKRLCGEHAMSTLNKLLGS